MIRAFLPPSPVPLHPTLATSSVNMTETRLFLARRPPDGTKLEMDFLYSTFFKTPGQRLPTPAQVRALSTDICTSPQPKPIIFRNPNIFVKFGRYVTVAEAQAFGCSAGLSRHCAGS